MHDIRRPHGLFIGEESDIVDNRSESLSRRTRMNKLKTSYNGSCSSMRTRSVQETRTKERERESTVPK